MLTIRMRGLRNALFTAAPYVDRGAQVVSCVSPADSGGQWVVVLRW